MAHTSLMNRLIACCGIAGAAMENNVPVRQALAEYFAAKADPRKHKNLNIEPAADGETVFSILPYHEEYPRQPSIVIIGAGLAGLTCAYRLWKRDLRSKVYEASECEDGCGDELIDADNIAFRRLAHEFGLRLDNVAPAEKPGADSLCLFNGRPYTCQDAALDFQTIYKKLQSDYREAGPLTAYCHYTPRGWALDHMSVPEWIEETVPGGAGSDLGRLLQIACNAEYGGESGEQSALNIVTLLGSAPQYPFALYGASDVKYRIHGGNGLLAQRLLEALPEGTVEFGARLTAIRRTGRDGFKLSLEDSRGHWTEDADIAVLAIPFTVLRAKVDYSGAGFSPRKMEAIDRLGSCSCHKVGLQTSVGGAAGEPEGNCFFAGAHTSLDFQGTLNGAVESGARAAAEVIDII